MVPGITHRPGLCRAMYGLTTFARSRIAVRAGAMLDLEEREMEASRRLLQKLPPVHHHDESPSESESTKSQSRRLYDRHSSGTLNPISPVTPVTTTSADAWMSSSAAGSSSSLLYAACAVCAAARRRHH